MTIPSDLRLPDFLVIGAEKGGTTWLHEQLRDWPGVFMPETKEIHFFNRYNSNLEEMDRYSRLGLEWYARFFEQAPAPLMAGEVTPMYLNDPEAPARIARTLPDSRLVCLLRNPVDRAYSHYWMAKRKGHVRGSFAEVMRAEDERIIRRGLYGAQLARYLELFDRSRLLVLVYEQVFRDPPAALDRVAAFLGVEPPSARADVANAVHAATAYRSAGLHRRTRRIARWMRERPAFAAVVDVAKRVGLKGVLDRANSVAAPYPPLAADARRELAGYYQADQALLCSSLGWTTTPWQ